MFRIGFIQYGRYSIKHIVYVRLDLHDTLVGLIFQCIEDRIVRCRPESLDQV